MKKFSLIKTFGFLALAGAAVQFVAAPAQARPNYLKDFQEAYPGVKDAATSKCGDCQMGSPSAKKWNDYGTAMGAALGAKNVKKSDEVNASLKKVESMKSGTEGKTFGDLLKDGKLPGTNG